MTLPFDLDDAATIDGCSKLGVFWRIILPLAKPALAAVAIFSFQFHWNDFFYATRCRLCVAARCGMARSGVSWRRLPAEYGKWKSVYRRLGRLVRSGRLAAPDGLPAGRAGAVRGATGQHGRARRARPPKKERDPALERSRAGVGTKIHILADQRGRPLCLRLTGGQCHDSTQARSRVEAWIGAPLPCLIADRAYDSDAFRAWRARQGIKAVISARKGRTNPQPHGPERYPARNAVERGLGWLKHGRRVATRYDQYAHRFLGFLYLAGAWIWLKSSQQDLIA